MSQASAPFFEAVAKRRTNYNLTAESTLSNEQLQSLVHKAIKDSPTAFNMQTGRIVLVTGEKHKELWEEVVKKTFFKTLGGDEKQIGFYDSKITKEYTSGYGTVLFFEDQAALEGWCEKMPHFAGAFRTWADNSNGMLQYVVWTALEAEGMGASLQHYGGYSPETGAAFAKFFDIPTTWKSTAMIPFGIANGPPGKAGTEKAFDSLEARVKTFF
ncbi:uncharacterized protein P7C73_g2090, partial [Tremellales sp. Uapishka_1]